MPRKPMVQRIMNVADCECLCCLLDSEKTTRRHVYISRPPANHRDLMKRAAKIIDNDHVRVVDIIAVTYQRTVYYMDLDDYIRYAKILRSKPISSDQAVIQTKENES